MPLYYNRKPAVCRYKTEFPTTFLKWLFKLFLRVFPVWQNTIKEMIYSPREEMIQHIYKRWVISPRDISTLPFYIQVYVSTCPFLIRQKVITLEFNLIIKQNVPELAMSGIKAVRLFYQHLTYSLRLDFNQSHFLGHVMSSTIFFKDTKNELLFQFEMSYWSCLLPKGYFVIEIISFNHRVKFILWLFVKGDSVTETSTSHVFAHKHIRIAFIKNGMHSNWNWQRKGLYFVQSLARN